MTNSAILALLSSLREANPGIGLKKLVRETSEILPKTHQLTKKEVRDICQELDSLASTTASGSAQERTDTVIKDAFLDFTTRERDYLLNLSDEDAMDMMPYPGLPHWHAGVHLRHHIEILLTLKGLKPCTLIMHYNLPNKPQRVFNGMVLECLAPVIERFHLDNLGFRLKYLASEVPTSGKSNSGFKGGWVFADTKSDKWDMVKEIFFNPHPERRTPVSDIGKVLGYPLRSKLNIIDARVKSEVQFKDETERAVLLAKFPNICCVCATQFYCPQGTFPDWIMIADYFNECCKAAESVGTKLIMNLSRHPAMDRGLREFEDFLAKMK